MFGGGIDMASPKITKVEGKPNFKLVVEFETGEKKVVDVTELFLRNPIFVPLRESPDRFESVHISEDGRYLYWEDEECITSEYLFENGSGV